MDDKVPMSFGALAAILLWYGQQYEIQPKYDIIRVIDGDTVVITAPFLPAPFEKELSLRISDINTPEIHLAKCDKERKLAEEVKEYITGRIEKSTKTVIVIHGWGKFGGRVIGDILLNGNKLSKILLDKGYAEEYDGTGKRKDWCDGE